MLFEDETLTRLESFQSRQRPVELADRIKVDLRPPILAPYSQSRFSATAFDRFARTRVIYEHVTHYARCQREKVVAVAQRTSRTIDQSEVRFMNQTGRIQRDCIRFASHPLMRELEQRLIQHW